MLENRNQSLSGILLPCVEAKTLFFADKKRALLFQWAGAVESASAPANTRTSDLPLRRADLLLSEKQSGNAGL